MIFLERRTAAAGVGDDGVVVTSQQGIDIIAGEGPCFFATASVGVQGAAAALVGRDYDFAAVLLEDAHGGLMEACEEDVGDAAAEHGDTVFTGAFCEEDLAVLSEEGGELSFRGEVFDFAQGPHQFQQTAGADE